MKTYLVTMTKRLTEQQFRELDRQAAKDLDLDIENWFASTIDEVVAESVSDVDTENLTDTEAAKMLESFYTYVSVKEEDPNIDCSCPDPLLHQRLASPDPIDPAKCYSPMPPEYGTLTVHEDLTDVRKRLAIVEAKLNEQDEL